MRAALTLISLLTLTSSVAFAQWEVRPAPPSWGLPQNNAPSYRQPMPQADTNATYQTRSAVPMSMNEAVTCAAALQVATMAAPNWAQERGIANITNAWLQKVFALAEPQGITGDKVPGLVQAEMQRQVDGAANDPNSLSRRAFDCASRQP
jgi:hypothetical protein